MNPTARLRTLVHVAAAIALAASGIALAQPLLAAGALLMVAVAELACRGAIGIPLVDVSEQRGMRALALPRWFTLSLIAAVLGRGVWIAVNSTVQVGTLCETVAGLLVIKLFDRRSVRDDAQIVALAVYLCIGAVLVSPRVIPSLLVAVNVPVILSAVMTAELAAGLVGGRRSAAAVPRGALRGVTIAAIGSILAISVVIFVLMPRGPLMDPSRLRSLSSWASGLGGSGRVTGFTDRIQLGRGGLISESKAIVLDVGVDDSSTPNGRPRTDTLYLRGAALSVYADGTWREFEQSSARTGAIVDRPLEPLTVGPGRPQTIAGTVGAGGPSRTLVQRIRMRGSDRVVPLFATWCPTSIEFVTEERISIDRASLTIRRQGQDAPLSYVVTSVIPIEVTKVGGVEQRRGRGVVSGDGVPQKVREFAEMVLNRSRIEVDPAARPLADDVLAMRAMEGYLRREFGYTLDLVAAPNGEDPVEWFLTTHQRGNCEYFASALALMARSVGIEARVITGYVAAEFSEATSSYVVRQSNAHAWVEARTGEVPLAGGGDVVQDGRSWHGWQTFDPTPPEDFRRLHKPEPNLAGRLGKWLDSVEYFWVANVVAFDDTRQAQILDRRATGWIEERLRSLAQFDPETGEVQGSDPKRIARIVGAIFGVTLVVFGVVGMVRWFVMRMVGKRVGHDPMRGLSRGERIVYRQVDRWVRQSDTSGGENGEGLLPLRTRVVRAGAGEMSPALEGAVDALYASRFGGRKLGEDEARMMADEVKAQRDHQPHPPSPIPQAPTPNR